MNNYLSRQAAIVSVIFAAACFLAAQSGHEPAPTPLIRVTTKLVVLDVVVTDKAGNPVTDLRAEDFTVEENGKKQKVAFFDLERTSAQNTRQALPPNVFSNRPEFTMPTGPATVLLIDGLNTPFADQARARVELIRYASTQMKPGDQVAVYALGNRLYKLLDSPTIPRC